MLIRYNQIDPAHRDIIRALENKPHIAYVRYLMLKRWSPIAMNQELFKLGMSGAPERDLWIYFRMVLKPIIQNYGLEKYYAAYNESRAVESFSFELSLSTSQTERIRFCKMAKETETDLFFAAEILKYYGGIRNIPIDNESMKPVIEAQVVPDFSFILSHPRRHYIEVMLAEGKSAKMIQEYMASHYEEIIPLDQIQFFAKAFFNIKRKELERTIDDLQTEIHHLENMLQDIRNNRVAWLEVSDRAIIVSSIKAKIDNLQTIVRRLSGFHHHAAYHAGVLEFSHIRDMFADVMIRSHRRYIETDRRTEDDAVGVLSTIVGMMTKATDKILALDERIQEKGRKTVSEEMLEVVMPTVDRVLEEERTAAMKYYEEFGSTQPLLLERKDEPDILGIDD